MPLGAKPGHIVTEATRQKIREALTGRKLEGVSPNLGRKQSAETIRRRAAAQTKYTSDVCSIEGCNGQRYSQGYCGKHARRFKLYGDPLYLQGVPSGKNHPNWKGDNIGRDAAHIRARQVIGRTCVVCGQTKWRIEAALLHTADRANLRPNPNGPYSIKTSDYIALCVPCHRQYDSPVAATRAKIEHALREMLR